MKSRVTRLVIALITISVISFGCTVITNAAPADTDITAAYDIPSVEELESALRYDLVPYAADYLETAKCYGLNVYFLVSKDAYESGWGRYRAAPNNLGGWKTEDGSEYMSFVSVQEYIDHTARNISECYCNPGHWKYSGTTLAGINVAYNGSQEWLTEVGGIWSTLERRAKRYQENPPLK